MSVIRPKVFKKQLAELKKSGRKALHKQVMNILAELEIGLSASQNFQSDDRIPHGYKFDLADDYQIMFQKAGDDFLALMVASHDETELFLENNRGRVFDPETYGNASKRHKTKKSEKHPTNDIEADDGAHVSMSKNSSAVEENGAAPPTSLEKDNEPTESDQSLFSPDIEADFVLGNFLDEVIAKTPRRPADFDDSAPAPAAFPHDPDDVEDFDLGDISDSAIDLFLKKHIPALRAELDDFILARQEIPPADEPAPEPSDIVHDHAFPETITPPSIYLKTDEPPQIIPEPESPLEILYELDKVISKEELPLVEPPVTPIPRPEIPRIEEDPIVEEPMPEEIASAEAALGIEEELPAPETPEQIEPVLQTKIGEETPAIAAIDTELVEDAASAEASLETIFGLSPIREETTTIFELPTLPQAFTTIQSPSEPVEPTLEPEPISSSEKAQIFGHAISLYRSKEYDDAILELKQLLKIDPDYTIAYKILGNAYFKNHKYSDALIAYEQYKKREPADAVLRENLAIIYSRLGLLQLAMREWQALLDLEPERLDIQRKIGRARQILDEQTKPRPKVNGRLSLLNEGILHYKNKNYVQAINTFREALSRYSESIDVYNFLGNAYFRNQMLAEAAQAYEKVKQMDSTCVAAYENMAVIFSRQGAHDRALKEWEKVLELNPQRQDVQEKIKKTIRKLRDAATIHPTV